MQATEKEKISLHCILASVYFLMLPLTITTDSAGASLLKLATIPIAAYFLISMLFLKKDFYINIIHLLLMTFTVGTVATLFVNHSSESIRISLGYFLNAALYICISVIKYNKRELQLLENIQVVLLVMVTVIPLMTGTNIQGRSALIVFGKKCDPNYFVGYFIFPLVVTLKKICESKWRALYIVLVAFSCYVILLTGSRGGLLAIAVTAVAFCAIYPKGAMKKLMILTAVGAFAVVVWIVVIPLLPESVAQRFTVESVVETRGTYRADIWKAMIETIKDSSWEVIVGRGLDSKYTLILNGKLYSVGAHNHFLQLVYCQGFLGFVTFGALIFGCLIRCAKDRKCVTIALIGMLALSLSLSFGTSTKAFWNLIPYAAFAFAEASQKKETEIKEDLTKDDNSKSREVDI